MNPDLQLTEIWHSATVGAGHVADAIALQGKVPGADVCADLDEAARRFSKASIEIRQMLSNRKKS